MRDYIEMQNGQPFYFDAEDPDWDLDTLIWGCARQPRWSGHFRPEIPWYSVAEHSCIVGEEAFWIAARTMSSAAERLRYVRTAYCHDLQEGMLGDMATPKKRRHPTYEADEDRLCRALARKYDLIYPLPPSIKDIDTRICIDETQQIMTHGIHRDWLPAGAKPLGVTLRCLPPAEAAAEFKEALAAVGVE